MENNNLTKSKTNHRICIRITIMNVVKIIILGIVTFLFIWVLDSILNIVLINGASDTSLTETIAILKTVFYAILAIINLVVDIIWMKEIIINCKNANKIDNETIK
jgi:hypothetical protein